MCNAHLSSCPLMIQNGRETTKVRRRSACRFTAAGSSQMLFCRASGIKNTAFARVVQISG
jgi:hypothetical protein